MPEVIQITDDEARTLMEVSDAQPDQQRGLVLDVLAMECKTALTGKKRHRVSRIVLEDGIYTKRSRSAKMGAFVVADEYTPLETPEILGGTPDPSQIFEADFLAKAAAADCALTCTPTGIELRDGQTGNLVGTLYMKAKVRPPHKLYWVLDVPRRS
jgi:hypothetical protein